jgi:hypothetical protein
MKTPKKTVTVKTRYYLSMDEVREVVINRMARKYKVSRRFVRENIECHAHGRYGPNDHLHAEINTMLILEE